MASITTPWGDLKGIILPDDSDKAVREFITEQSDVRSGNVHIIGDALNEINSDLENKADADLSNVTDADFKAKAEEADVAGRWGLISGMIDEQEDLQSALSEKANADLFNVTDTDFKAKAEQAQVAGRWGLINGAIDEQDDLQIALSEKANTDLSNVTDTDFKAKAEQAQVAGRWGLISGNLIEQEDLQNAFDMINGKFNDAQVFSLSADVLTRTVGETTNIYRNMFPGDSIFIPYKTMIFDLKGTTGVYIGDAGESAIVVLTQSVSMMKEDIPCLLGYVNSDAQSEGLPQTITAVIELFGRLPLVGDSARIVSSVGNIAEWHITHIGDDENIIWGNPVNFINYAKLVTPSEDAEKPAEITTAKTITSILQTIWNKLAYVFTTLGTKADSSALASHAGCTNNPHNTTASQVGLGNVTNTVQAPRDTTLAAPTADSAAPAAVDTATAITSLLQTLWNKLSYVFTTLGTKADSSALSDHTGSIGNPHGTTAAQVGLGNVTNTVQAPRDTTLAAPTEDSTAPAAVTAATAITSLLQTIWNKLAGVVRLADNQTIAGTKTFSTSPVVPSKTAAVANTGTAIATEAQVYLKANLNSPALTGTPTAPTAAAGTNTTQIATTAFVNGIVEVGTWTPGLNYGLSAFNGTFAERNGYYLKIGRLVYVSAYIRLSTKGTSSNTQVVSITGLPFAVQNLTNHNPVFALRIANITVVTGHRNYVGCAFANSSYITPFYLNDAGTSQGVSFTTLTDTTQINITGCYRA